MAKSNYQKMLVFFANNVKVLVILVFILFLLIRSDGMKHLNLLLLTCLSCMGLIYGMEEETSSIGFSYRSKPKKLTSLVGNSPEERINCRELDLSHTEMEYVNLENLLSIFPNLTTLNAVGCGLTKIDPITTPNNTLKNIDFSGNQLQKWQMSLIAQAVALKQLNLSDNKIDQIDLKGTQEGLSLNLENNDILYLELHPLYKKPLAYLNLNGNNLTEAAYHEMLPYLPVDHATDKLFSRIGNLLIAGSMGTVVTLLGLYYGWYREQDDRNVRGTAGTVLQDKEEIWAFTELSFLGGGGTAAALYYKLNKASDKLYALQHQQHVKEIDLGCQQNGWKLLRDEHDKNK
jgi:hypothetical protein